MNNLQVALLVAAVEHMDANRRSQEITDRALYLAAWLDQNDTTVVTFVGKHVQDNTTSGENE